MFSFNVPTSETRPLKVLVIAAAVFVCSAAASTWSGDQHVSNVHTILYTFFQGSLVDLPKNGPAWHSIRSGRLDPLPHCSPEFNALLTNMIAADPTERPTTAEVLHHPTISPMAGVSKAQLKKQLNEQKWKNKILERLVHLRVMLLANFYATTNSTTNYHF